MFCRVNFHVQLSKDPCQARLIYIFSLKRKKQQQHRLCVSLCVELWRTEKLLHVERDDERGFIVKVRHQTFAVSINLHIIPEPRSISRKATEFCVAKYSHPTRGAVNESAEASFM